MKFLFISSDCNIFHLCSVLDPEFLLPHFLSSSPQPCELGRAGIIATILPGLRLMRVSARFTTEVVEEGWDPLLCNPRPGSFSGGTVVCPLVQLKSVSCSEPQVSSPGHSEPL